MCLAWQRSARTVSAVALVLWSLNAGADASVSLVDALQHLRSQGFEIFYSNDLVTPEQRIDIGIVDIDHLREALPSLGLRLVRNGDVWLIERDQSRRATLTLRIESTTDDAITLAEFQFKGQKRPVSVHRTDGVFVVNWPRDAGDALTVVAPGHYPRTLALSELVGPVVLQAMNEIENVIVTGSRHQLPAHIAEGSAATITADEMSATPTLGGDSMRVTNRLPGMSTVGVTAKPYIRGGVQDETLTLIDGVELLDPFHLADFQSIFSSVDSRIVSELNVYTGGFPARYGNRMSGVVDISTLAPTTEPRTELGISVLSTFVNTAGSTVDQRTDWLGSVRHGNLGYLADIIDPKWGDPTFDDAYARIGRRIGDDAKIYAGVVFARDDTSITDDNRVARSDIESSYLWTRLDATHRSDFRSSTVLAYVDSDRNKHLSSADPGYSVGFLDYGQQLRKGALRSDFRLGQDGRLMEFGLAAEYASSKYDSDASIDRGRIGALLGNPNDAFDIHTDPSGWSGGAYWSAEIWVTDRIALQPGIRWDIQDYAGDGAASQISPRLGIRWDPTDQTTLRLAGGRYAQPEGIHEMKAADGIDHFLNAQRSNQVVASLDWTVRDAQHFGLEAYYKDYSETRMRFENLLNPFVLTPELESDRAAIPVSRAKVKGVDAQARLDIDADLSCVMRYSYMDADDRAFGRWSPRGWSQRHTAQSVLAWQTERWSASAAVTWHSGWRTSALPASVPLGAQIAIGSIYNDATLNDYWSLDLSMSRVWQFAHSSLMVHGDLTNAVSHANRGGVEYKSVATSSELLLFPNNQALLPSVPTAGIVFTF